jgi:hypothetical protein
MGAVSIWCWWAYSLELRCLRRQGGRLIMYELHRDNWRSVCVTWGEKPRDEWNKLILMSAIIPTLSGTRYLRVGSSAVFGWRGSALNDCTTTKFGPKIKTRGEPRRTFPFKIDVVTPWATRIGNTPSTIVRGAAKRSPLPAWTRAVVSNSEFRYRESDRQSLVISKTAWESFKIKDSTFEIAEVIYRSRHSSR